MSFFYFLAKNKTLVVLGILTILLILVIGYLRGPYEILDLKFFYLKSEIQPLFMALGEDGRATYLKINMVDFVFITVYTLFFYGMYFAFFKDLAKTLILVPTFLAIADIVETATIFHLLRIFPETSNGLEYLLMFTTPAKWMLALSSLLVIVNGYFVNLYMKKS